MVFDVGSVGEVVTVEGALVPANEPRNWYTDCTKLRHELCLDDATSMVLPDAIAGEVRWCSGPNCSALLIADLWMTWAIRSNPNMNKLKWPCEAAGLDMATDEPHIDSWPD